MARNLRKDTEARNIKKRVGKLRDDRRFTTTSAAPAPAPAAAAANLSGSLHGGSAAAASASASASPSTSEDGFDSWDLKTKRVAIMMELFDIKPTTTEQDGTRYTLTAKGDNHKPEGKFSSVRGNDIPGGIIIYNNDRKPCSKIRETVHKIFTGNIVEKKLNKAPVKLGIESSIAKPTTSEIQTWEQIFAACNTVSASNKAPASASFFRKAPSVDVVLEEMNISEFIKSNVRTDTNYDIRKIFEAMEALYVGQSFDEKTLNKLKEDLGGEGPLANVALAKIHSFLQDNGGKDYKNLNLPASTVKKLLKLDNPEAWQGTAGFKPCDKNKVARRVSQLVTLLNQKGRGSTRLGDAIDWLKERSGPYSDDLQESGCLSWFQSFCRNATKSSINTKINVLLGSPQRLTTPVNLNS